MEKFFKLKENGTNVRTEVIAGLTTFLAMAYILAVNPSILSAAGMDRGADLRQPQSRPHLRPLLWVYSQIILWRSLRAWG